MDDVEKDYGPKGSLFVSPDGKAWRYQATRKSFARDADQNPLWDQPFYTYDFEVWENSPRTSRNRVYQHGTFGLPEGAVRVWTPPSE